jgi:hypothetical protein
MAHAGGPIKGAKMFRDMYNQLRQAQKGRACYVNEFMPGRRTGVLETLTYEVTEHPLVETTETGILVRAYFCRLYRRGAVAVSRCGTVLAFLSWHALGRLRERDSASLFDSHNNAISLVAGCGMAGLLLRKSLKHLGTGIHFCIGELACIGVLREAGCHRLFDVLTILPRDDLDPIPRAHPQDV